MKAPKTHSSEVFGTLSYFSTELGKIFQNIQIQAGKVKKGFFETKIQSGNIEIILDPSQISPQRQEAFLGNIIGHIESIQSLGNIRAKKSDNPELTIFFKNFSNGYYKFFYNFLYRQISLHRSHIAPAHRAIFFSSEASQFQKLKTKYNPLPKHIDFLGGISGKETQDSEVKSIIQELQENNIISRVLDPRIDETTRLSLIHTYFLPQYEYLLSQDKKNWKNTKKTQDTIDDIVEKTKKDTEVIQQKQIDTQEDSPTGDTKGDADIPDYQETYDTPEGGNFEKGNKKSQGIEISPGLKGYFAMDQKNHFDTHTLKWTNTFPAMRVQKNKALSGKKYRFKAQFGSPGKKALPLPYGYAIDIQSAQITGNGGNFMLDSIGNFFYENTGKTELEVDFGKDDTFREIPPVTEDTQKLFSSNLTQAGMQALKDAENENNIREKIRIVRDYITSNHFYPPGKNVSETNTLALKLQRHFQDISTGADYFFHLDTSTHLECYSANSLLVAMLRHIGIPARLATGHHVQSLAKNGKSYLTSGNGHGWTMVWDGNTWVRFDATPAKDLHDPRNKKDPKEKKEDDTEDEEEGQKGENADDGGEDTPAEGNGDEGEEGQQGGQKGKSSSKGKSSGQKGGKAEKGDQGTEEKVEYGDIQPGEEKQDDFEKMYEELSGRNQENEHSPGGEKETKEKQDYSETDDFEKMVQEQAQDIQKREQEKQEEEPYEREIRRKYPQLSQSEIERLAKFMKEFQKDLEKISQVENPLWKEGKSEYKTLEEALKAIFDRVVSRRIKEREIPRYPVPEGDFMIDPVQLYIDYVHGIVDSYSFQTSSMEQEEELKIVKIRKRKILDASGSMDTGKLRTQQMIEVLDNKVTAIKQREINELSESLSRDLRLETETWQFGTMRANSSGFTLLKALGSEFSIIEQSAIWNLSAVADGGTNDFDPLEAIYESLRQEEKKERKTNPYAMSPLQRIRIGFLIRERESLKRLETNQKRTKAEEVHYRNLTDKNPKKVAANIRKYIPLKQDGNIDETLLSPEEFSFLSGISLQEKSTADIFEEWIEVLQEKDAEIEPILEIIEVSSDGGSNDETRLKEILQKLRSLGVIVISYGLGNDGKKVEEVYRNDFNPDEGGNYCQNLLDYPGIKMKSWAAILDTI